MLRVVVPCLLALVACGEPDDDSNAPLATDYLPARSRDEARRSCEEIEGSKGRSVIVTDEGGGRFVVASLPWSEAADVCKTLCGANQRLANTKEIAAVRDDPDASMTASGIRFDGDKRARATTRHFWVSAGAFTDPYRFERKSQAAPPDDDTEPRYAVMCITTKK
ncbi:MAG: hypothetical protein KIT84_04935 [Labilithrix sp.]|nr:hypothetical protein [Labilithrix sp.]MCW5810332.1 hypothetical protein [Labilithrix sp.]